MERKEASFYYFWVLTDVNKTKYLNTHEGYNKSFS
jgi:hypothetical protein